MMSDRNHDYQIQSKCSYRNCFLIFLSDDEENYHLKYL